MLHRVSLLDRTAGFNPAARGCKHSERALAAVLACIVALGNATADDAPEPIRVFTGTVVDEAGAPLANALVEWGHFQAEQSEREFTFTNAAGEYRLETTRAWQDFRLGVHKPGYGPRWVEGLIPTTEPSVVDFTLPPPKELTGVVVGPGGEPLPGVRVLVQINEIYTGPDNPPIPIANFPGPMRVATTNAQGEFVVRDLADVVGATFDRNSGADQVISDWVVVRFADGNRSLGHYMYRIGETLRFVASRGPLTPDTTGELLGVVLDAQTRQPITEFRSRYRYRAGLEEFTSAQGEFSLTGSFTRDEEYEVEVFADGYAPASMTITADAPGEKPQATIELTRHPPVQCEVVDAVSGVALPGVIVYCGVYRDLGLRDVQWIDFVEDGRHYMLHQQQAVSTDSTGRASFQEGQLPNSLFIIHPGYARTIVFPEDRESLMTEDKVLRIPLMPESRITGRILLDPVPGADFELYIYRSSYPKDEHENFYGDGSINEDGEFEINRLSAGTYLLRVWLNRPPFEYWEAEVKVLDGEHVHVDVGAPAGPYTLRGSAPPFAVIRLTPWPAGAEPVVFSACAHAEGRFEVRGIPEGVYESNVKVYFGAQGIAWDRQDFVEIAGDTERDFTAVPLLGE